MNGADAVQQIITPWGAGFWLALDLLLGVFFWFGVRFVPMRWRNLALIARWVAVPYLGLIGGGISPRLMGLSGIDWRSGLMLGVGLIAVVWGLLLFVQISGFGAPTASGSGPSAQDALRKTSLPDRIYSVLASGAEEFHWCFLRSAFLAIALVGGGGGANGYGAIWLVGLIAVPETLLAAPSPSLRLHKVVAFLATTILFLFVRNFWLCWALHASIMLFAGNVRWPEK